MFRWTWCFRWCGFEKKTWNIFVCKDNDNCEWVWGVNKGKYNIRIIILSFEDYTGIWVCIAIIFIWTYNRCIEWSLRKKKFFPEVFLLHPLWKMCKNFEVERLNTFLLLQKYERKSDYRSTILFRVYKRNRCLNSVLIKFIFTQQYGGTSLHINFD